jgi:DNA-binding XRE family transcriptional regulator
MIRQVFRLQQTELAKLLGVTAINIHRWERVKVKDPYNKRALAQIDAMYQAIRWIGEHGEDACNQCSVKIEAQTIMLFSQKQQKLLCIDCFNAVEPELYIKFEEEENNT